MTEEERQRLQAELLRKQQEQVAMLSQSAMTPEELAQLTEQAGYDPSGKEAMLATMLRGGQDAVFGDMPQGKQIGDIYVAPTWSESLNAAAQKGIGGYQMGQARKEQTAIDEKRGLSKAAAAKVAAEQARIEQLAQAEEGLAAMLTDDQKAAMEQQKFAETQANNAARNQREAQRLSLAVGADRRAQAADARESDKRTVVSFHNPMDPAATLNLRRDASGNFYDMDGNQMPGEFVSSLTPYTAPQTGSVAKAVAAQEKKDAANATKMLEVDQATMTILDPNLGTATGHPLDPERWASQFGLPGYEDAQATATRAQAVTMGAVAPTLDKLGVNPTDRDLKEAFKTVPGLGTQPETWMDWYENTYMPAMSSALQRDNPAVHDSVMAEMRSAIVQAREIHKRKRKPAAVDTSSAGWSVKVN